MTTSNLEPANQGTPFCTEGPLLVSMLCWLVHLDSWYREHPTPLSHEGYFGEQGIKMYANACFSCYSIWKADACFRYFSNSSTPNGKFNFPAASPNIVKAWPMVVFMSTN